MILRQNITIIRKRWDLNQTQFAALLEATRTQVSNWERGRTVPALEDLQKLAHLSGIEIGRLNSELLPLDVLPDQPGNIDVGTGTENPILLELKRISARLEAIEQQLAQALK